MSASNQPRYRSSSPKDHFFPNSVQVVRSNKLRIPVFEEFIKPKLEIKSGNNTEVLKAVCGYDSSSLGRESLPAATASLAALCVATKLNGANGMPAKQREEWMKPMAPSLQRGTQFRRARQRLLGEKALDAAGGARSQTKPDPQWSTPCNESRHIW